MAAEKRWLDTEPSDEEKAADLTVFEKYGELNVLDRLSDGDVTKWDAIKRLPFEMVLTARRMKNTQNQYQERYNEIRSKAK